jgi:sulfatase modifying factor 1
MRETLPRYAVFVLLIACGSRTALLLDRGGASASEAGAADATLPPSDSGPSDDTPGDEPLPDSGFEDRRAPDAVADSSDAGLEPPSCAPGGAGMTNCGPGGMGNESCCTSLEVEGGTFFRTYAYDGGAVTGQADPATVSTFRLDKYVVTVGRFRQFVKAWNGGAGYVPPAGAGKHAHLNSGLGLANSGSPGTFEPGWVVADDAQIDPSDENLSCDTPPPGIVSPTYTTWTPSPGSHESLPIDCPNWWEAYAFCIWDGGFLPSETEWEFAGAGGDEQREYPWGSTDPGTLTQYAIYDCDYPGPAVGECTGVANFAPVGTPKLGAGLWGQLDMAGEVFEWSLDQYAPYVDPCVDCAYLATVPYRVVRGGTFWMAEIFLEPAYRTSQPPTYRSHDLGLGFRCARAP